MAWCIVLVLLSVSCGVGASNCRDEDPKPRSCENLCDEKGNCAIRAALLLPRNTSYDASLTMVESALELALQQEAIKWAFPDWVQFEWKSYDVEDCDAAYAVIGAIDAYNDCAHVFFGPSCDFALAAVARIGKFLGTTGTPMVTTGGFSYDFAEPKQNCSAEFYMLVRAGPVSFKDLAYFLIATMKHYSHLLSLVLRRPFAEETTPSGDEEPDSTHSNKTVVERGVDEDVEGGAKEGMEEDMEHRLTVVNLLEVRMRYPMMYHLLSKTSMKWGEIGAEEGGEGQLLNVKRVVSESRGLMSHNQI